jgi:hypothetical protein
MPINAQWDNQSHTIIRYHVQGSWELEEYSRANFHTWTMIDSVEHPVHVIVDFTNANGFPKNLLSFASTTNSQIHPRQELIIGVKIPTYLQTVVGLAVRAFPRLGHNLFFTQTLAEAYDIIQKHDTQAAR